MKKPCILYVLITVLFVSSIIFAGCGGSGGSTEVGATTQSATQEQTQTSEATTTSATTESTKDTKASSSEISAPGEYPIVPNLGDAHLTFLVTDHPAILDWATNDYITWITEQTNVTLDFETVSAEGKLEKLNIILAAGDIPDAVVGIGMTVNQTMRYGQQEGLFIPLNDLIDEHGYYIKDMFNEYPSSKTIATMTDGNIYALPAINDCFHVYMPQRYWMNEVWLDNLGLQVPTTTDELYNVLVAFRDNDANGNGDPNDEIPFSGCNTGWWGQVDTYIMNAFCYYPINLLSYTTDNDGLFLENGVVTHSFDNPAFKEGLTYLNKLYSENLLYSATFNQSLEQLTQLAENPSVNLLGSATSGYVLFATMGGERYGEYTEVLPLTGPGGYKNVVADPYVPYMPGHFAINANCPIPEIAIKWADMCYSQVATINAVWGPQDVAWEWAHEGDVGLDGKPALWRQLIPWQETEPQNLHLVQCVPDYRTDRIRLGLADDLSKPLKSADRLETWLQMVAEAYWEFARPENKIPPLIYTIEEADAMMVSQNEVNNLIKESITGFINGTLDVAKDYDSFRADLDTAGLPLLMEYKQKAYEAQWK